MLDENGVPMYNTVREMLCAALAEASSYLDNYAAKDTMHRQRVKVATSPDGSPSYRWVQGRTHDELNDAIVREYISSGRIREFTNVFIDKKPCVQTLFRDLAELWFTTYKSGLKPTSRKDYRYQLDNLLYPTFGDMFIQDISITDIQNFLNDHADTAKSTLNKSVIVIDQLFDLAIREGLTDSNPVDKKLLKYSSGERSHRNALSQDVFKDIVSHIHDIQKTDDQRLLALLIFTGMRRGEVLGLKWDDVDFEGKAIHVNRNVTYPDNDPVVGTPKSKSGTRVIPLDERLAEYLLPQEYGGFILGGDKPYTKSMFRKAWQRICKQIDLHGASCHIFRHTYATMLNNAGVSMKTMQAILGHSDISTTMNIYTHSDISSIMSAGADFAAFTQ